MLLLLVTVLAHAAPLFTTPPQTSSSASRPQSAPESAEAKQNRKQAYLRYIEAQRLKATRQPKWNELIALYKEIIQLDPTAADPHADLGEIYFLLNQPAASERELREAIRLDPDCLNGHKWLARLYIINVRFDKDETAKAAHLERAIREYEEVARIDSGNAEAWAFLADLFQMKNDVARQIKALEKLTTIGVPTETVFYRNVMNTELSTDRAWYQLSQLYRSSGQNQQAIEAGRRAFELDPESSVNARNLMDVMRLSSNGEEELQTYLRLLKRFDNPMLEIGHSAALVRNGRYTEAITKLRELLKADPTNPGIAELLAVAQRRSGKRAEAVETLKQAIAAVEPAMRQKLNLELGETYEELGRTNDAIAYYEGIYNELVNKPKLDALTTERLLNVVARLTRAYNQQGDKKKAQAVFTKVQQVLGANHPLVSSLLIESLREEGKYLEALEATRAMLARDPKDRSLKITEALILSDLKNYPEGITVLEGLLTGQAAADSNVLIILSNMQMQSGQYKEAEATIRKALAAAANDTDLLIQLSSIQDRSGQRAEAEKTLRAVLQREPDNATALNNLGYFLAERSARYSEALPLIEKAVSIEPLNGSFLDSLGWVQYKLGRLQEARGHLEKATQYARRNATIYEHLGDVLRDLGRHQEARRNWEVALEYSVDAPVIARLKDKIKSTQ
jgi:tetratricopeptide (TPR) repeat protein